MAKLNRRNFLENSAGVAAASTTLGMCSRAYRHGTHAQCGGGCRYAG